FAGAFPPFGFFAFPTVPDPFPSLAPCWSGVGRFAFAFRPFRLYQIRFGPLPVRIRFRIPVGGVCLLAFPTLSEEIPPN
ncbi:hypothetical protein, partial [Streptomyces nigrescens]